MSTMASQIASLMIVYSTVSSGTDGRKHHISASLAFVRGIHRWPVNFPHKGPVTRKMFPFDDIIMNTLKLSAPTNGSDCIHLTILHPNPPQPPPTPLKCRLKWVKGCLCIYSGGNPAIKNDDFDTRIKLNKFVRKYILRLETKLKVSVNQVHN